MNLRRRLVVVSAGSTLLAVVALGLATDVLVARHLRHELDRTLRVRAVEVAQLSATVPALLTAPGALDSPVGATSAEVEVLDARRRIVARSLSLGGRVLPVRLALDAIGRGRATYASVAEVGDTLRVYAAPLATGRGPAAGGAVLVAASTKDVRDTIHSVQALTLIAALLAAAGGAAVVAVLVQRALRPLARLDRAASEIERSGDPRSRLPAPERSDEVARLTGTLNAMLESLERSTEAERRFVADASHELRTPLTALRGNIEHLARHGLTAGLIDDLQADSERLARLADDLLALSREEATPAPSDEVRLDELAQSFRTEAEVTAEPVTVLGDRRALERAIRNLLENARQHGSGRPRIEVRSGRELATLTVSDQGDGLDAAGWERAFQRFSGDGTGLGLAIVLATASRHGGRVWGEGSSVTIELVRKPSERGRHASG